MLELLSLDPISEAVEIERWYDPSIPELMADGDRLAQVFLNLARNALQAMAPDGGNPRGAHAHAARPPPCGRGRRAGIPTLAVEIADTGPGIPTDILHKLATPFFTTRPDGTGLGLAVSRNWIVATRGHHAHREHRGQGHHRQGRPALAESRMMSFTAPARVLVADDEPSIRFVLRETLEEEGFDVVDVEDGEAAFEQLAAARFELAFLDIRMPGSRAWSCSIG